MANWRRCDSNSTHGEHLWLEGTRRYTCGGVEESARGYEVYEVTIRIPVDASENDPWDWDWETMLGVSTEVMDTNRVEGFASPTFQEVYDELRESELGGESIVDQMKGLG